MRVRSSLQQTAERGRRRDRFLDEGGECDERFLFIGLQFAEADEGRGTLPAERREEVERGRILLLRSFFLMARKRASCSYTDAYDWVYPRATSSRYNARDRMATSFPPFAEKGQV